MLFLINILRCNSTSNMCLWTGCLINPLAVCYEMAHHPLQMWPAVMVPQPSCTYVSMLFVDIWACKCPWRAKSVHPTTFLLPSGIHVMMNHMYCGCKECWSHKFLLSSGIHVMMNHMWHVVGSVPHNVLDLPCCILLWHVGMGMCVTASFIVSVSSVKQRSSQGSSQ